eukprot:gene8203-16869_t
MAEFWKPVIDRGGDGHPIVVYQHNKHLSIPQQRRSLPIWQYRDQILYALESYKTVVLVGETGCGKTTQIPQYLHEFGWTAGGRCVVCTQPRRMAAISVATRVAEEMGVNLGNEVGYAVRFDSKCNEENTVIKFCTDGLLLRETMSDPILSKYSVIMIDEAHERTLHSDILLGLLKKIKRKRKDLRIIVTSATLNATPLCEFFETNTNTDNSSLNTACILSVQGRLYPVDVQYLIEPVANYLRAAVDTVLQIHQSESAGDVLVFLPGGEDIDNAIEMMKERHDGDDMYYLPLYSSLPFNLQMKVFEPSIPSVRKVIFCTNIAETSITIDGIVFVVDSGYVKLNYFDFQKGLDMLVTCPVSRAAAKQRAGRAGRTRSGKCFRLMPEASFNLLSEFTPPEMQRTEMSWAVLQLKALGIYDVLHFDFLSPPSTEAMIVALEMLFSLGALDSECHLTVDGEKMAEMPIEPRMSKTLLSSFSFGCSEEMLTIAAMCSVEHPFITMRAKASQESKQKLLDCISEFAVLEGDHLTLLNVFNAFEESNCSSQWCDSMCLNYRILSRAIEVRKHLKQMLKQYATDGAVIASCGDDTEAVRKCIIAGYFANAAKLGNDGQYWTVKGHVSVTVHHTSIISRFGTPPEWVVYNEIIHAKTAQIREVTKIEPRWLTELAEHYYILYARRRESYRTQDRKIIHLDVKPVWEERCIDSMTSITGFLIIQENNYLSQLDESFGRSDTQKMHQHISRSTICGKHLCVTYRAIHAGAFVSQRPKL